MDNSVHLHTCRVCRTCMHQIMQKSYFCIDSVEVNTEVTIRQVLNNSVPELDLSLIPNPVICSDCLEAVKSIYEFKHKCLQSEIHIHKYIEQMGRTFGVVNLEEVVQSKSHFIDTDVKLLEVEILEIPDETETYIQQTDCTSDVSLEEVVHCTNPNVKLEIKDWEIPNEIKSEQLLSIASQQMDFQQVSQQFIDLDVVEVKNVEINEFKSEQLVICDDVSNEADECTKPIKDSHLSLQTNIIEVFLNTDCGVSTAEKNTDVISQNCLQEVSNKQNRYVKTNRKNNTSNKQKLKGKTLKCSICEYQCKQNCRLKAHMVTHTKEKVLKCSLCDYQCKRNGSLKRHITIHDTKKKRKAKVFKCSDCEYKCDRNYTLKVHMRIHTGEKPYRCLQCPRRYIQSSDLTKHILLKHVGEQLYKCLLCNYQCMRKYNLVHHMEGYHAQEEKTI